MLQGLASSINVVKNAIDSFGAHEFMARTNVPIRQFADSPGQPVDAWEPLGPNEWWDEEGTVCAGRRLRCVPDLPACRPALL